MKQAVLLAAGLGQRMGEGGRLLPKSMTRVGEGSIIENALEQLCRVGFQRAVVVTGHLSKQLVAHLRPFEGRLELRWVHNPDFASTNNIYSLWLAREHLAAGFHLFEADVMFEGDLLDRLEECPQDDVIVVDPFREPMNGTVVTLDAGTVRAMILGRDQGAPGFRASEAFKTVNIYRFGAGYVADHLLPGMASRIEAGDVGEYYEVVVRDSVEAGFRFRGLVASPARWWEIDTPEDLAIAKEIFAVRG